MGLTYRLFSYLSFIVISIKYTYDRFAHNKFPGILLYKIGLKRYKINPKGDKKCIWIHATSLGETMSTKTLMEQLAKNKNNHVIFSTFTTVGYNYAKTLPGIDQVIILPLDLKSTMRDLVRKIQPDLFILIESDYWANFLNEIKKFRCKMLLLGGRISDRSYRRFKRVPVFARALFSNFDYLFLQDQSMKEKFIGLGIAGEKIEVIGNLKLDTTSDLTLEEYLPKGRRYITLGSTHQNEEESLLKVLDSLDPDISFVVAPRRPDRFLEVENLLKELGLSWRFVGEKGRGDERIIFVNKLGVLERCYAQSEVAIVCGSFFYSTGGHNVYEPVRVGTPVLYGPYTFNQKSLTKIVEDFGVGAEATLENILESVERKLKEGRISEEKVAKIKMQSEGATEKAINLINSLL